MKKIMRLLTPLVAIKKCLKKTETQSHNDLSTIKLKKKLIETSAAPKAIGTYSQAIIANNLLFISGQIPLDPNTLEIVDPDFSSQAKQVFKNLENICLAAGKNLQDIVRLTIYLVDLNDFQQVNECMAELFQAPFPARATVQISALPKGARIEIDAIATID